MSRQSEYKKRLDPELGRYTRQHIWSGERSIYGEGIKDVFKTIGSKIFGKTMKKAAKKGVEKALTSAATKTGEYAGKKAGDKIVQMLSKGKVAPGGMQSPLIPPAKKPVSKKNNQQHINRRVNAILSGGKII